LRKRASCPGSMGVLVQGFREGKEVLISLPIDRYSEMEVIWQEEKRGKEKRNILWKSEKALEIALREWGMEHLVGQLYRGFMVGILGHLPNFILIFILIQGQMFRYFNPQVWKAVFTMLGMVSIVAPIMVALGSVDNK